MHLRKTCLYGIIIITVFSGIARAHSAERDRLCSNISSIFNEYYAPKEWKTKHYNWNLENELNALTMSADNGDISQFHDSLKKFFINTRDYHTSIYFADTSSSVLPLGIKYINQDFYIAFIDSSLPPSFPLMLGDKVISINDKAVKDLAWQLIGKIENPSLTDWALAAKKLSSRTGMAHDKVEKGSALIKVERDNKLYIAQLAWNYNPNKIKISTKNNILSNNISPEIRDNILLLLNHIEERPHKVKLAEHMKNIYEQASNPLAFANKESFLPKLGKKIIWSTEPDSKWQAYIYKNSDNKLIGFIRLPTFAPSQSDYAERAQEFGEIINKMEEITDALVIDQQNNPGGSIFYLYALLSMLTDQPLKNPHHRFSIDSKEAWQAYDMLKNIDTILTLLPLMGESLGTMHGYPLNSQFFLHMKSYFQFIIEQWEQGKRLTDPYFLYGVDYIQPHSQYRYTKKLIVLVNELDFSAGDFFPAILQDSKRALIVGTRTAGAGGYVLTNTERNQAGILQYSYTGSHALRDNGPLEDLGVMPDIDYQISVEDLKTRFLPFVIFINAVVKTFLEAAI